VTSALVSNVIEGGMAGEAVLSECRTYRYALKRRLSPLLEEMRSVLFIMLNPSTADADADDPTIRKCMGFARRLHATSIVVVNLFALRATNPEELRGHADPVGPLNDAFIAEAVQWHRERRGSSIIAAWGSHTFARPRARHVIRSFGPFDCLGVTADGSPRHPLYLPYGSRVMGLDEAVLG